MSTLEPVSEASLALVTERVERLLLRYDELQRTNELLRAQLSNVEGERDVMKSRLNAARARIDALLDRLPANLTAAASRNPSTNAASHASSEKTLADVAQGTAQPA